MKPRNAGFISGDHWAICDRCGVAHRQSTLLKEWNGYIVCKPCWEPRQPQDFVRGRADNQSPKGNVRPEPADIFIDVSFTGGTAGSVGNAVAGLAIAGVAIAGTGTSSGLIVAEDTIPTGTFNMNLD